MSSWPEQFELDSLQDAGDRRLELERGEREADAAPVAAAERHEAVGEGIALASARAGRRTRRATEPRAGASPRASTGRARELGRAAWRPDHAPAPRRRRGALALRGRRALRAPPRRGGAPPLRGRRQRRGPPGALRPRRGGGPPRRGRRAAAPRGPARPVGVGGDGGPPAERHPGGNGRQRRRRPGPGAPRCRARGPRAPARRLGRSRRPRRPSLRHRGALRPRRGHRPPHRPQGNFHRRPRRDPPGAPNFRRRQKLKVAA